MDAGWVASGGAGGWNDFTVMEVKKMHSFPQSTSAEQPVFKKNLHIHRMRMSCSAGATYRPNRKLRKHHETKEKKL